MGQEAQIIEARSAGIVAGATDFGVWTNHRIPPDRSGWHPMVRRFYDYWLSVAPPGKLPGRQHIAPEDLVPLLPRLWMLDVHRNPLRLRYRLAGTQVVWSLRREVTGQWLDEMEPDRALKPIVFDRYRFIVETGRPTWRHGVSTRVRERPYETVENCLAPLAADGKTVDTIFGVSVLFDFKGKEL